MRALVTGANGFVGRYLRERLAEHGYDVVSAGRQHELSDVVLELRDQAGIMQAVESAQPDVVFHLAAQTFVPSAHEDPVDTYETNVMGTARLLHALGRYRRGRNSPVKVMYVSSAQVYGRGNALHGALGEEAPLVPVEPYAASKAAAEKVCLAAQYSFGLDVVIARAFNHIGPGQDARFVVSSFAQQLAHIVRGGEQPLIEVGNLEAERDFLDVRDVVEAYITLAEHGSGGNAYNVCSGQPIKVKSILRMLILEANVPVEVREDPEKMRPIDVPQFFGDNQKLRALGWAPKISIQRSLREIYADALRTVTAPA
ncbi:MAG: GDP-mannose 4,6-dehydratase [Candidatus Eremiobacteraeota bacterium]|nr:GDP-mannose 4,6-dehydratase [Candidatus Eremiobacteraeota bacterium]